MVTLAVVIRDETVTPAPAEACHTLRMPSRILVAVVFFSTGCMADPATREAPPSEPVSGINLFENLEPIPGRPDTYRPIKNFAEPQEQLRSGPFAATLRSSTLEEFHPRQIYTSPFPSPT